MSMRSGVYPVKPARFLFNRDEFNWDDLNQSTIYPFNLEPLSADWIVVEIPILRGQRVADLSAVSVAD